MDTKSGEQGSKDDQKQKRKRLKKILSDIQRQVEFYFSDSNLRKDRFIKQELDKSEDGCIDISIIANFNRMKALANDQSLVVRAMENCDLLEVSEDKTRVKRKKPLKESKYNENDLTVYVENLPQNVDLEMLTKMFSACGNIAYVSLPRYKYSRDTKGFAFVEFTTPDAAANACKLLDNPSVDKPIDGRFPVTRKGRLIPLDVSSKEKALTRKRVTSETEVKTHAGAKEEVLGDGKGIKASKRKREASEGTPDVDEGAQLEKKAKRKSEISPEEETKKHDRSSAKKDAETPKEQKSAKKRKQSAEPASEATPHKGQRLDFDASGESAQKDKSKKLKKTPAVGAESHNRKRDDSISSVDSLKQKSSASRRDAGIVGREGTRKRTDSEASGGEDGDKKKKRNRSRKQKRDELEAPMLQIRVIPKKKWLDLKDEYLAMQKTSRQDMKKVFGVRSQNGHKQKMEAAESKVKSMEPAFVPGVVLKINSDKPFASRTNAREQIQGISPVAYIDLKDGDTCGFVRLKSAEGAKAVLKQASKLKNEDGQFEVALVSGEDEEAYWKKLKLDRFSKLNQARNKKKRGVNRILDKTEKVLGLSKSKNVHKQFE